MSNDNELEELTKDFLDTYGQNLETARLENENIEYHTADTVSKFLVDVINLIQSEQLKLLESIESVIGVDVTRDWDSSYNFCNTCDFEPTDDSDNCICKYNNRLKAEQRQKLQAIINKYKGEV